MNGSPDDQEQQDEEQAKSKTDPAYQGGAPIETPDKPVTGE
jgi:hypothetical protein